VPVRDASTAGVAVLRGDDGVVEVVLDRPHRRNALSGGAMDLLTALFTDLADEPDVGAVLLRGEGDFFCSGIDIKEFDAAGLPMRRWMDVHLALARLDVPVLAAVTGGAVNAGAALVLAADLVVIGASAFLRVGEVARGLVPPVNLAWLAVRHGGAVADRLCLSGDAVSGAQLLSLGLALHQVADYDVVPAARALARRVAGHPDGAARRTKIAARAARPAFADVLAAVAAASS
jgi:2-(1,2-epoxy-1,2-dihydrophenyl)acetyl-CoA isomerase